MRVSRRWRGGAVYDPAMMLAVLLYAYCTGERSSRRIERRLVEDVAYRVVAANQTPDHATLARFRRRHQDAIAGLFAQVLGLCVKAGLVDAGVVAIDGTKIAANASFFANRDRGTARGGDLGRGRSGRRRGGPAVGDRRGDELAGRVGRGSRTGGPGSGPRWRRLDRQGSRDYESRMAERAAKEATSGRKLTGPKPSADTARRHATAGEHDRSALADHRDRRRRVCCRATTPKPRRPPSRSWSRGGHRDDQRSDQLRAHGPGGDREPRRRRPRHAVGTIVADAGYWSAANGTAEVGAEVLIATRKSSWRRAPKPDDDKLAVLARVNRGELSQRQAGEILGVSYTWVRDMTKRYFGDDGQRITRHAEPEPDEWIPVIERLDRGEISKRAAADQLGVSAADQLDARPRPRRSGRSRRSPAKPWTPSSPNRTTPPATGAGSMHRAGLREHQSQPRIPAVHPARPRRRQQRMAPHLHQPTTSSSCDSADRLTGIPTPPTGLPGNRVRDRPGVRATPLVPVSTTGCTIAASSRSRGPARPLTVTDVAGRTLGRVVGGPTADGLRRPTCPLAATTGERADWKWYEAVGSPPPARSDN